MLVPEISNINLQVKILCQGNNYSGSGRENVSVGVFVIISGFYKNITKNIDKKHKYM